MDFLLSNFDLGQNRGLGTGAHTCWVATRQKDCRGIRLTPVQLRKILSNSAAALLSHSGVELLRWDFNPIQRTENAVLSSSLWFPNDISYITLFPWRWIFITIITMI